MRPQYRFAFLLVPLFAGACGGGDGPAAPITDESVVATYTLRSVSGQKMPFTAARTDDLRLEITSGRVVVAADRGYTDMQVLRLTQTGQPVVIDTVTVTGTWVRNDNTLVVTVPGAGEFVVLLRNKQLLKQESGFTYDYRK